MGVYSNNLGVGQSKTSATLSINGAINGNIGANSSQDLRRQNGTPYNQAPFGAPFNGEIVQMVISNNTTNNYTIGVIVNNTLVLSLQRTNGQNIEIFDLISPITISKSDQIRLRFLSGVGSTNRPAAQLTYKEVK